MLTVGVTVLINYSARESNLVVSMVFHLMRFPATYSSHEKNYVNQTVYRKKTERSSRNKITEAILDVMKRFIEP